jgi:hypothetical protein
MFGLEADGKSANTEPGMELPRQIRFFPVTGACAGRCQRVIAMQSRQNSMFQKYGLGMKEI